MMQRLLTLGFIFLLCLGTAAQAITFTSADGFTIAEGETYEEELWLMTDSLDVSGIAGDDIFALSATATLSGTFDADVWLVAQQIVFTGEARQHVRFAAETVRIGATIDRSLMAAANSVALLDLSVVKGDAVLIGESVLLEGKVLGNARLIAQSVTVNGSIDGNLRIIADDIVIMPGSEIGGSLVYTSSGDLVLDSGVILGGELTRKTIETEETAQSPTSVSDVVTTQVFLYLCALVTALPFVGIFPKFTGRAVRVLRQSTWKCLLVGIIAFCIMPMASLFALITILGMPLSFIILAMYFVLLYLSKVIVALVIGGIILRRRGPQPFIRVFTALSLGLIVLYVATAIPYFGGPLTFVIVIAGLGALVLGIFSSQTEIVVPLPPHLTSEPPPPPENTQQFSSNNDTTEDEPQTKE